MINLVADKEICQEAKGIIKDSKFYWSNLRYSIEKEEWEYVGGDFLELYYEIIPTIPKGKKNEWMKTKAIIFPAPLTDEILKVLPSWIEVEREKCDLIILKEKDYFECSYDGEYCSTDKKLSNALYKLLIKLVKEGIIKS